jgi:tellurite resistance-related uncharacterized protein
MNYQNEKLPEGCVKVGETPVFTEDTVPAAILGKHMAPKGKYGYLVVLEGACQYVWEDEDGPVIDSDPGHPIVIFPERYHHVKLNGSVKFKVEFYQIPGDQIFKDAPENISRPGESFL